jgi:glycosyltransferase involved in cell wall biosynthesis
MKLLFVIKSLTNDGGGAERVFAEITAGLACRGHDITVATYDRVGERDFYPIHPLVDRRYLGIGQGGHTARPIETIKRAWAMRRLAASIRPDVVIAFMHSAYIPLGLAMTGSGLPLVASEHIIFDHYRTVPLQGLLLRLLPPFVAAMTVISDRVKNGYPRSLRRKMTVIANPVNIADARPANVSGGARNTILSIGRLAYQKDQATLIEAFDRLAMRYPDWQLRIVGEGELRPVLERQIARSSARDRITLPGSTPEIDREYEQAQIFALPSRYESFGLVTAEALAHGLPVIGFADCPGTNELIVDGDNGVLVSGTDRVAALADGLEDLMRSPAKRLELSRQGPASIERFSVEAIVDQWADLLASIAETGEARPGISAAMRAGSRV